MYFEAANFYFPFSADVVDERRDGTRHKNCLWSHAKFLFSLWVADGADAHLSLKVLCLRLQNFSH